MAGDRNLFFQQYKMIWIFKTYIPDGAEKAARRAVFPERPAYDVLKNPSPIVEKIDSGRTRL